MADEEQAAQPKDLIPGVKHVIAISSGKGGVGKSTVAANLACTLALTGAKVGLMDADLYGPNIPMMMGSTAGPEQRDGKIVPVENHRVKLISMAYLVPEEAPLVWRGPMVHQYLQAFFRDVLWGRPRLSSDRSAAGNRRCPTRPYPRWYRWPGRLQSPRRRKSPLRRCPQGHGHVQKVNVPLLGIIENMSFFVCGHCGERTNIFSHGGGERAASKLGIPFLGSIPVDPVIREGGDTGQPIVVADPGSPQAAAFREIAKKIMESLAGAAKAALRSTACSKRSSNHLPISDDWSQGGRRGRWESSFALLQSTR